MAFLNEFMSTILVGVVAFAACNIGEVFILVTFYLDKRFTTREIVIGQYLSGVVLLCIAFVVGVTASAFSPTWLHALGILPLFIGVRNLFQEEAIIEGEEVEEKKLASRLGINTLTVALITFADASDNLGVFAPIFADSNAVQTPIVIVVFLIMVGLLCWLSHYILHHRHLGKLLRRFGDVLAPLALIVIGLMILLGIHIQV